MWAIDSVAMRAIEIIIISLALIATESIAHMAFGLMGYFFFFFFCVLLFFYHSRIGVTAIYEKKKKKKITAISKNIQIKLKVFTPSPFALEE